MGEPAVPPVSPEPTDAKGRGDLAAAAEEALNLSAILSIPVTVQVVLGSALLPVATLMKLVRGGVISLDQRIGDPVEIVVNGRVVARGEIVVVDEASQRLGVSLLEIVPSGDVDRAA